MSKPISQYKSELDQEIDNDRSQYSLCERTPTFIGGSTFTGYNTNFTKCFIQQSTKMKISKNI